MVMVMVISISTIISNYYYISIIQASHRHAVSWENENIRMEDASGLVPSPVTDDGQLGVCQVGKCQ